MSTSGAELEDLCKNVPQSLQKLRGIVNFQGDNDKGEPNKIGVNSADFVTLLQKQNSSDRRQHGGVELRPGTLRNYPWL
jgi:hypothetical protein